MTAATASWCRRHRAKVIGAVATAALVAGGLALAVAVQRARTAASRTADL